MAKIAKNADKFPIQWDGDVIGGENQGDEIPTTVSTIWGSNPYTWSDFAFIQEIVDGIGTHGRQARLDKLLKDEDKKKRIIHLICRVKGVKVFDEDIEVKNVQVDVKDVDMVAEQILGKVKMETENVV